MERIERAMTPIANGYLSIAADGGDYWTFGTSDGKYGEYAKFGDTFFSVNKAGLIWAKAGSEKGDKFIEAMKALLNLMASKNAERSNDEI